MGRPRIMIVAVEPSADAIGAALLGELRELAPQARVLGCGGPRMAANGFQSLFPIDRLSVMGLIDALRALPEAQKRARDLSDLAVRERIDAAVFIDAWGFSRLCAGMLRKRTPSAKLFKLGAPQVWASRPRRVNAVRALFDGVLCLLPFEPAVFEKAGVRAEFMGNPNYQTAWRYRGDGDKFRELHELGPAPLLVVLPGSRKTEARRLLFPFAGAVRLLAERLPGLRVVAVLAPQVEAIARPLIATWPGAPIFAGDDEKYDAFAAADAALAKSGTVTTELAINRTPMAVAYKFDPVTAIWIRRIATTRFASIINIAAERAVIPEFLQENCRPDYLAAALEKLMTDRETRLEQLEAFPPLLAYLGVDGPPAARRAAETILDWMKSPAPRRA
jgi:lipid-A-disaccharide synthase